MDYNEYEGKEYTQVCAEALKTIEGDLMRPKLRSESMDLVGIVQEVGEFKGSNAFEGLGYQVETVCLFFPEQEWPITKLSSSYKACR